MRIADIMAPSVVSIEPEESAALAARLLARYNIGLLPVCSAGGALRGVLTDRDLILRGAAAGRALDHLPVQRIMTRYPITAGPEEDPRAAAARMAAHQIRRLPVVHEGIVVGIISLGDLARCGRYEMELSKALTDISDPVRRME